MNQSKSTDRDVRDSRAATSEDTTPAGEESRHVVNVPDDHSVPQSRRSFLGLMTSLMGTAVAGVMGVVFAGYSLFPVFKKVSEDNWTDVGPIDEIPVGEPTKKAVVVSQDGGWGRFNSQQLVWIKKSDDNLVVYSAACPHLGCTINAAESGFICPCHGSAWDRDGSKVGGPAPRGMDTLEYRVENGTLQVKYRFYRQGIPDKQVIA